MSWRPASNAARPKAWPCWLRRPRWPGACRSSAPCSGPPVCASCGLEGSCPLVFIARDEQRLTVERARTVAAGFKLFGDPRLPACFGDIVNAATEEERATIAAETTMLCPALLEEPGLALSGDPR